MALKETGDGSKDELPAAPPAPASKGGHGGDTPQPGSARRLGPWLVPAYVGGLVLLFAGERIFPSYDWARWLLSGLGVAAVLGSTVLRFMGGGDDDDEEKRGVERTLALFSAGGVLAVALYFATTDAGKKLIGVASATPETRARFDGAATVAWIVVLVVSVVPLLFGERALAPMRGAERIEARRVRAATLSGLTLACAVAYCALLTYATGELDKKVDFSYFRTARPSESTKNIAQSLTEPVKVMAFFPQLSDVGIEAEGYLRELGKAGGENLTVEIYDRLLVPQIAKDARVTQDGTIVVSRGSSRETLTVGAEMKTAAAKLKSLDGDFQKALLKVVRSQRTAYFTVGHNEMNEATAGGDTPEGRTAKTFKKMLESQNYSVKDLGLAQGLAGEIPKDAHVVVVLGPQKAFLPEEVRALSQYADRGGKLLLALDPESKADLEPLAETVGLTWQPALLATDDARHFYPRRRNPSDHTLLITNKFSSHASVTTLSRNSARAAVVFPGAGGLDKKPGSDAKIDFAVKTFGDVFNDANGNFEFDQASEKRAVYNLCAAVSQPKTTPGDDKPKKDAGPDEMRSFACADADVFSDAALANEANLILAVDAFRWLGGEESFSGAVSTTEDVRIEHTKQKDVVWFYGTIFAAPALVLGLGLLYTRRGKRARGASAAPAGPARKAGPPPRGAEPPPKKDEDDDDDDVPEEPAPAKAKPKTGKPAAARAKDDGEIEDEGGAA